MKRLTTILCGACLVLAVHDAGAQVSGAIQQVDAVQQRRQMEQPAASYNEGDAAPELYPGENSDVGPQSVLKIKPRKTFFEAMADAQYFHTDNMFFTDRDKQGADVLVSTVQIALAPTPYPLGSGQFAPRLGYRHQWFDYGLADSGTQLEAFDPATLQFVRVHLNAFDFNAQTLFADGRWSRDGWLAEAGIDYTRLMSTSSYDEFYREYAPHWAVQRVFPLNERGAFSLGYAGDYRFTDSRQFFPNTSDHLGDRTDQVLFATYTQMLCRRVYVQPYYQFKFTHFTREDRDDYLHSLGLALNYSVCPSFKIRAFVGYDINESGGKNAGSDYRQFDAGGGVNAMLRF